MRIKSGRAANWLAAVSGFSPRWAASYSAARRERVSLREGVYAQLSGPNYETPAEIRMLRALGADAVGMSTACEATAARHMGMEICGVSCITNMAAGILDRPLDHQEVQETADRVKDQFERLVTSFIGSLA